MNLLDTSSSIVARQCPVCCSDPLDSELFAEENIDEKKISGLSFASRKPPELMSHRLVCCQTCDLVYAPKPPTVEDLANAYHRADYDSSEEAIDAANAYMKASLPVIKMLTKQDSALEIGCGTGIFLEFLAKAGFKKLVGIEPSQSAINAATPTARAWIEHGIFEEKNFEPQSFDFVCCFMTLEHVRDPMQLAKSVHRILKPGGVFVTVTHDYRSLINRFLGMRSPIIDIEHLQLFSAKSIQELFTRAGYKNVCAKSFVNTYSLGYWLRLSPIPRALKNFSEHFLDRIGLIKIRIPINVGNQFCFGYKKF
jgi:SAM-dependent methyltransferase